MNRNVFNKVGSLTVLRRELTKNGIDRFMTFNEIAEFMQNYNNEIQECIRITTDNLKDEIERYQIELEQKMNEYHSLIDERRRQLKKQIVENEEYIVMETKFKIISVILKKFRKRKNDYLKGNIDILVEKPFNKKQKKIDSLKALIDAYSKDFNDLVKNRSEKNIAEIHHTLSTLKKLEPIYYGAVGELQAVKALSSLDDSYYIINDLQLKFNPPIYDKRNNDRIYSIQVDHVVVGPTGVFIIETKNWSQESINSFDLFSPIRQLKRSSFALFVFLNDLVARNRLKSFKLHWGDKKISINKHTIDDERINPRTFSICKNYKSQYN